MSAPAGHRLVTVGALVFGLGFGGLADGIVLHQVLQWHNLITDVETNQTLDGQQRNLFWDGVFHAATAALAAIGLLVLWYGRGTGVTTAVAGPVPGGAFTRRARAGGRRVRRGRR